MRTTLRLDDDVLAAAKRLAERADKTLGAVVSELVRKGLDRELRESPEIDFPVFSVPEPAAPITPELVRKAAEGA